MDRMKVRNTQYVFALFGMATIIESRLGRVQTVWQLRKN